jgi:hypothetical protein
MMQRLPRRERIAVGLWLIIGLVAWNGIYDVLLARGAKDYLFRNALHELGRGPDVDVKQVMAVTVTNAMLVSTFWACLLVLAGMITIRLSRRPAPPSLEK